MNDMHVQQAVNPNQPMQVVAKQLHQGDSTSGGQHRIMPKQNNFQQYATNLPQPQQHHNHNVPTSHHHQHQHQHQHQQVPLKSQNQPHLHHNHHHHSQQQLGECQATYPNPNQANLAAIRQPGGPDALAQQSSQTRVTIPLEGPLMGPFRLDHDAQFTSRVFHINAKLFDTLSKSMQLMNPQTAIAVQELQFRAYLVEPSSAAATHNNINSRGGGGDSLLASNHQPTNSKSCNWPELLQLSINQNVIHLDRSKAAHKAVDIFQYCHAGDNVLEIQVNDCYCVSILELKL